MNGTPWTPEQLALLRALYADTPTAVLARRVGHSTSGTYGKAKQLGLAKSEAFLASDLSGRRRRGSNDPRLLATQFKPGQTPWNKGTHFAAGGRSVETRFKPGRAPKDAANYKPLGSLRVNADGVLERKVTDDQSIVPARRWVPVHRLIWEAAHGPIPDGCSVIFRCGQRTAVLEEITIDRLECVSRAELMRRNTKHRLPLEVRRLVQLKGAITRQVNRITRESKS